VDTSLDIAQIVRDVTGEDPVRVLTHEQITAEPDMWGIQAVPAENNDSGIRPAQLPDRCSPERRLDPLRRSRYRAGRTTSVLRSQPWS
jgi:hypothetical protein